MSENNEELTKELEEIRTSITSIKKTIDELNKNFGDFLDIIIPLLEDPDDTAQEQMKLIKEHKKQDTLGCGNMFG